MRVLFLSLLILGGCTNSLQTNNGSDLNDLKNTAWILTEDYGEDIPVMNKPPTLNFSEDRYKINGSTGCNSYGGEIAITEDNINFKNVFSTKMFCEGRMGLETKFLKALEESNKMMLTGDKLKLFAGNKIILVFERIK